MWVCWPWFGQNTGLLGGFFLAFGWCATAVFVNNRFVAGIDGLLTAFYGIYMLLSFFLTGRTYGDYELYYHVSMVTLFFLPYYMARFYFKRNETKFLGKIAIVAMVCMFVGCLTSIYYTAIDENIMKTISQSLDTEFLEYRKAGIGSFGFIYMLMFCIISFAGLFKAKLLPRGKWTKLLLIIFCAVGVKCLIDSTFTTAILLLFLGLLFVFVTFMDKTLKKVNWLVYVFLFLMSLVLSSLIGNFLSTIQVESADVTVRLNEIGRLLMGEEGGENVISRLEYFMKSVNCALEYPLLGYNFAMNPQIRVGGHSEWIDILGIYGLIGGIPLIATVIIKLKNTLAITRKIKYPFFGILIFVFVIYGFVDPFLRLYHLGFVMFLLIPCFGCLPEVLRKKEEIGEEVMLEKGGEAQ